MLCSYLKERPKIEDWKTGHAEIPGRDAWQRYLTKMRGRDT